MEDPESRDDPCPVCGHTDWGIDYVGPEEMPVSDCNECHWPGPGPRSVEEARAQYLAEKQKRRDR